MTGSSISRVSLARWAILIFLSLLVFTFLHEVGHGFGSWLTGVHVSTGFNRVGNAGKFPDDPDFRNGMQSSVLGGILGPGLTLSLAVGFTLWLVRRSQPDTVSLTIGAAAISNALLRLIPMALVFGSLMFGRLHIEDEVGLGIDLALFVWTWGDAPGTWEQARALWDRVHIVDSGLYHFGGSLWFWLPPAMSLGISLLCLVLVYRRLQRLFGSTVGSRLAKGVFLSMPLVIFPAFLTVANHLDRIWRINW